MPKLLVGSSLADFRKPEALEESHELRRFQDRQSPHRSLDRHQLRADELRLDGWLPFFQKQLENLPEVCV